ncbi:MAG: ABC transporter substrate-binding protein, partial [Bacteroides sp.]
RFYGRLYGCARQADSLFAAVEERYLALKAQATATTSRPLVLMELKSSSAWYVPGGQSTTGILCRDAGARYAFAEDTHSGSVPLSFETVFSRASEADYWLFKYNRPYEMTYTSLEADYAGYAALRPFRERQIYTCHTGLVPFYEETPFHPDLLLSDLLHIVHPELAGNAAAPIAESEGLHYFCRLKQ